MSFAFLPLYTGDYLRDTRALSPREHGVYLLMLMWCWNHAKPMPNDMLRIYRLSGCRDDIDEKAVDYVIGEFFVLGDDNCYHNLRLERELSKSNGLKKRGKAGAKARWGKPNGNDDACLIDAKSMLDGCLDDAKSMDPTPTPIKNKTIVSSSDTSVCFSEFWRLWPSSTRKVAKAECAKKWRARNLDAVAERIIAHVAAMKSSKPWQDGYEPSPLTYLNQKRWEDEIEEPKHPPRRLAI